jgi:hypothetical protein
MLHIKTKPRCYHPGANFPIIFGHPPMAQCTKQQSPVTKLHVHRTATAACKPPARREVVVPCADVPPMFRRRPDWLDAITTLGGRADRGLYGGELESAPPPRQLRCAQVVRDMPSSSGAEQGSKRFAHGESGEERPFRAAAHEGPVQTSVRVRASDGRGLLVPASLLCPMPSLNSAFSHPPSLSLPWNCRCFRMNLTTPTFAAEGDNALPNSTTEYCTIYAAYRTVFLWPRHENLQCCQKNVPSNISITHMLR